MTAAPDVTIGGAGIVGAACAWELARAGAKVEVVDRGIPGGGATAAGMGHLVDLDDELSSLSVGLWHDLAPELPKSAEFWRCGTLWIAATGEELEGARSKPGVRMLDAQQLYEEEPNLRPGLAGGAVAERDAVVYAPVATRWLLEQAGVTVRRERITSLDAIRAGAVVCAAGALATRLLPDLPIKPRKGHLAITDRYPGLARHQLVELGYMRSAQGDAAESVAFNVQPRPTGQLLIGSSRQFGIETPDIDPPLLDAMLRRAFHYLPALAGCNVIRTWTGFRASTPDKLPLIGPYRGNVYLATGHEGLGVTTSLGTAKVLAAHLLGRPSPIPVEPYLPERFHA